MLTSETARCGQDDSWKVYVPEVTLPLPFITSSLTSLPMGIDSETLNHCQITTKLPCDISNNGLDERLISLDLNLKSHFQVKN